mgnify:CR=1 FL=1
MSIFTKKNRKTCNSTTNVSTEHVQQVFNKESRKAYKWNARTTKQHHMPHSDFLNVTISVQLELIKPYILCFNIPVCGWWLSLIKLVVCRLVVPSHLGIWYKDLIGFRNDCSPSTIPYPTEIVSSLDIKL